MTKNLPSNLWNSPAIRERLELEATFDCARGVSLKKHYWVIVPHADGEQGFIVLSNFDPNDPANMMPHEMQQQFAIEIQRMLQKEAHHDGLWVVGFTHPPSTYQVITDTGDNVWGRTICLWLDGDGDPQYTVESDIDFVQQIQNGVEYYANLANEAHEAWKEMYSMSVLKDDMGLKEENIVRPALETLN